MLLGTRSLVKILRSLLEKISWKSPHTNMLSYKFLTGKAKQTHKIDVICTDNRIIAMGLNIRCLIVWEKEMLSVFYRFNNQSNAVCIKWSQKGFDLKVPNTTRPQRTSKALPSLSLCVKCFPMENYLITRCGRLLEREAQPSKPSLRSPSSSSSAHKAWKGCVLVVLGKSAKAYVCAAMLVSSSPPLFILHINWIVDEKKLEGRCVCWGKKSLSNLQSWNIRLLRLPLWAF